MKCLKSSTFLDSLVDGVLTDYPYPGGEDGARTRDLLLAEQTL